MLCFAMYIYDLLPWQLEADGTKRMFVFLPCKFIDVCAMELNECCVCSVNFIDVLPWQLQAFVAMYLVFC